MYKPFVLILCIFCFVLGIFMALLLGFNQYESRVQSAWKIEVLEMDDDSILSVEHNRITGEYRGFHTTLDELSGKIETRGSLNE